MSKALPLEREFGENTYYVTASMQEAYKVFFGISSVFTLSMCRRR